MTLLPDLERAEHTCSAACPCHDGWTPRPDFVQARPMVAAPRPPCGGACTPEGCLSDRCLVDGGGDE